ncbi:MAG: polysaccharide biosynthesis/export family protein [Roseiarcus sp.]
MKSFEIDLGGTNATSARGAGNFGAPLRLSRRSVLLAGCGLAQTFVLTGCGVLSRDGPAVNALESEASAKVTAAADQPVFNYVLLDIDDKAVAIFGTPPVSSLYATFGHDKRPAPEIRVGVGDVVQVTIFESQAGGLFIPTDAGARPGNFVTLPAETIDRSGTITVPYAGDIHAVGRTIPDLQSFISKALSNRAIEPQTVITVASRASAQASVLGAVTTPGKIEVGVGGDRVLEMIARAGGINAPGYEMYITVQRDTREATVYFDTVLANSRENIFIRPADIIYVYREPHRYVAFGAVKTPGEIDFGAPELTLVEAVAKAAGLDDARADPRDMFLYRSTPRILLERADVSLDNFPKDQKSIPVVFRANFRDPASYFAATHFKLANKDVIYVSNSASYELYKFLELLNNSSSTIANVPLNLATAKYGARYLTGAVPNQIAP